MSYNLSKDYESLYEKVINGMEVVAYVDYTFSGDPDHVMRDICAIKNKANYCDITFGVRGVEYGGIYPFDAVGNNEKELFIKECERLNLEWIKPNNP